MSDVTQLTVQEILNRCFDLVNNRLNVLSAAAGSDTQVQFNNAGVLGGDAGFTYNLTTNYATLVGGLVSPNIVGGTGTTSDLTLKTTSGVGAAGADMHFLVGNNGATEALTILNSGYIGIGITSPEVTLDVRQTGTDVQMRIGPAGANYYDIGRQGSDGNTVGFLRFCGAQAGYGGYYFTNADGYGVVITNCANVGIGTSSFGTNASDVLGIANGASPASSPANIAQIYAADYAAGQSCIHTRDEAGAVIKLRQQAKASYNNWAAFTDVVNALVAMGILDAA